MELHKHRSQSDNPQHDHDYPLHRAKTDSSPDDDYGYGNYQRPPRGVPSPQDESPPFKRAPSGGSQPHHPSFSPPYSNGGSPESNQWARRDRNLPPTNLRPQPVPQQEQYNSRQINGDYKPRPDISPSNQVDNENVISAILALAKELGPAEIEYIKREIAKRLDQ